MDYESFKEKFVEDLKDRQSARFADLLCTDRRQDGFDHERHHDKVPYSQMYQSSDLQEFHGGADCQENGFSRKVLLISFSNQDEIKRACVLFIVNGHNSTSLFSRFARKEGEDEHIY